MLDLNKWGKCAGMICLICGEHNFQNREFIETKDEYSRWKCKVCGTIQYRGITKPEPQYDEKYNHFFLRAGDIRKAGLMAARIIEEATKIWQYPKILEVGPGNGLTGFLVAAAGYTVVMVDVCEPTLPEITAAHHLHFEKAKFEDFEWFDKFDFIYAGHTIEHSNEPLEFMKQAESLLRQGGVFLFDTPATEFQEGKGAGWKHLHTRQPFEHKVLLSQKGVEILAREAGFHAPKIELLPEYESMLVKAVKRG